MIDAVGNRLGHTNGVGSGEGLQGIGFADEESVSLLSIEFSEELSGGRTEFESLMNATAADG